MTNITPKTVNELLNKCDSINGLSFLQLSNLLNFKIPILPIHRKGWLGKAMEIILGTDAGNQSLPDFQHLNIELKTIPVNLRYYPCESTFITHIPLGSVHQQSWLNSQCYAKLKCILWIPVEGDITIPFIQRRIGKAFLWTPTVEQELVLANDWQELTNMISMGYLDEIHAGIGEYLQIRPKAANSKSLCHAFDRNGNKTLTMPRGFYLRALFTKTLLRTRSYEL